MDMKLKSPSFPEGGMIPARFSCQGPDLSPALEWQGSPAATRTLALICDDPTRRPAPGPLADFQRAGGQ